MTRRMWAGFAVLCLLAGSAWIFDEAMPGLLRGLPRTAVHDCVLAIAFGLVSLGRRKIGGNGLKIALGAIAMFAVPEILFAGASGHVSETTEMLVFLLVPVVVIFVVAQKAVGFGSTESPLRMLVPALAALGGATLLVPFDWPPTVGGRLWVVSMVGSAILAGVAAVWMHGLLQEIDVIRAASVGFGACGIVAAAFCWIGWTSLPTWSGSGLAAEALRIALEAPILLLTVWLLREMRPIGFSARLYFVPLVTILEGFALLRPGVGWEAWIGVVLMVGGGVALLRE